MINDPILTNAENPTFVEFLACNFAFIMDEIVNGIKDITRICKLSIPSLYCGKNSGISNGDKNIIEITRKIENAITNKIIFVCFTPLDSSDKR